jgi:hypothetical protein
MESRSAADAEGPWIDTPGPDTGLVLRFKKHWNVPIIELSNAMLATFLRQRIALALVIPEARKRIESGIEDGSKLYDGELAESLERASSPK